MKDEAKGKRLGGWEAGRIRCWEVGKLGSEEGEKITGQKMGGGEAERLDKFFG